MRKPCEILTLNQAKELNKRMDSFELWRDEDRFQIVKELLKDEELSEAEKKDFWKPFGLRRLCDAAISEHEYNANKDFWDRKFLEEERNLVKPNEDGNDINRALNNDFNSWEWFTTEKTQKRSC